MFILKKDILKEREEYNKIITFQNKKINKLYEELSKVKQTQADLVEEIKALKKDIIDFPSDKVEKSILDDLKVIQNFSLEDVIQGIKKG